MRLEDVDTTTLFGAGAGLFGLYLLANAASGQEQQPDQGDGGDDGGQQPDDGDDGGTDWAYEEADDPRELSFGSNSWSGAMHYRVESVGEIAEAGSVEDSDEIYQDEETGLWVLEGQFGPAGADTYDVYATGLEYFGVFDLEGSQGNWDYTDTPTPVNFFDVSWDGSGADPADFAAEVDVAEAEETGGGGGDREGPEPTPGEAGIRHDIHDGPVGGGSGMPAGSYYSRSEADIVVTDGDLSSAVSRASPGDIVYVVGDANGGFSVGTPNVVIAGSRGNGGDGEISNGLNVSADGVTFNGLVLNGGSDIGSQDFSALNVDFNGPMSITHREPRATFTQCGIHGASGTQIRTGGYQSGDTVTACGGSWHMTSYDGRTIFEYCDIYNMGRFLTGTTGYWHVRDCHFRGACYNRNTGVEIRAPNACRESGSGSLNACGSPAGTAIIEHNRNDMERPSDGDGLRILTARGVPYVEPAVVRNNYSTVNSAPCAGCEAGGQWPCGWSDQLVLQNASSRGTEFDRIEISGNEF